MNRFIAATALVMTPLAAAAADLPGRAPAVAPVPVFVAAPTWSGLYVGVYSGWAGLRTTATDISGEEYNGSTIGGKMSLRQSGVFIGGLTVGYNLQYGAWVLGPELEIGYMRGGKTKVINGDDGLLSEYKGLYGFAGARLGYSITSNVLLYAKAGVVSARVRSAGGEYDGIGDEDDSGIWGFDGNESAGGTKYRFGFAVGGGLEFAVSPNWSIKGEYLYKDFGSKTYQTLVTDTQPFKFRDTAHTVRLGVNYRFGGGTGTPVFARY